jgi:hypothetical protein
LLDTIGDTFRCRQGADAVFAVCDLTFSVIIAVTVAVDPAEGSTLQVANILRIGRREA